MRARPTATAFTLLLAAASSSQVAGAAGSADACSSAYTKGQEDRLAGRLFSAREAFKVCASASCPSAIAGDCARWKTEVEADLPTVRLKVTDAQGAPIANLRLSADGLAMPDAVLTRPVILEAGPHVLRFEARDFRPLEVERALRPTARELEVAVVMHRLSEPLPESGKPTGAHTAPNPAGPSVPALAVALASVGVVALGGSLYFGLRSHAQYEDLKTSCAPLCDPKQADSVRSNALISDVALLTSAAAFGAAAWVYFSSGSDRHLAAALNVQPSEQGAVVRLRVAF